MMILDATKKAEQRALLEAELEAVGIRLNREPPYDRLCSIARSPLTFLW
jgi:ribosome-interacting GTPase 1